MRLSDLKSNRFSRRCPRRVGRGIAAGQGASCGFGMRGQKSRSGRGTRPGFEGGQLPLYRRIPKLKHFPSVSPRRYVIVNVNELSAFTPGSVIDIDKLVSSGLITNPESLPLKILGSGAIDRPLSVKASCYSKSARASIEAAGGSCIHSD